MVSHERDSISSVARHYRPPPDNICRILTASRTACVWGGKYDSYLQSPHGLKAEAVAAFFRREKGRFSGRHGKRAVFAKFEPGPFNPIKTLPRYESPRTTQR